MRSPHTIRTLHGTATGLSLVALAVCVLRYLGGL